MMDFFAADSVNEFRGFVKDLWIVIPARGGSRGIPRKNLTLCAGKPLIQHSIETAIAVSGLDRVIVISDDLEIDWFARQFGIHTFLEAIHSGPGETLDEKIERNIPVLRKLGARDTDVVLTVQPTSPLLKPATVWKCYEQLHRGDRSVLTVVEDRHLTWSRPENGDAPNANFANRVNRQEIPPLFRETGGVIGARLGDIAAKGTRVISPVGLVTLSEQEAIDIDSFGDLFEAEHWKSRSKVIIRADAGFNLGMGHIYRGLALAYELSRHDVTFAIGRDNQIAHSLLAGSPFAVSLVSDSKEFEDLVARLKPDLLILDILDTQSGMVRAWKAASPQTKLVTFEDDGSGAPLCDVRVCDLTAPPIDHPENVISGIDKAILAPSFELVSAVSSRMPPSRSLLVSFGGTDPAGLTEKVVSALEILEFDGSVTVVTGLGARKPDLTNRTIDVEYKEHIQNMALVVSDHRLAISSMGRTVFELASSAVPVLCFAQNEKESSHVHIGPDTGSVFGGLGYELSSEQMADKLSAFLSDTILHQKLTDSSEKFRAGRTNKNVIGAILSAAGLGTLA